MNKTQETFLALLLLIASILAGHNLAKVFVSVPAPPPTFNISGQLSFSAKTDQGVEQSLADAQAQSFALVYFFAADCNHCANLLRSRGTLFEDASKIGFKPIGVAALGPNFGMAQLTLIRDQFRLPSPVFGDVNDKICGKYGVGEFTVFLIDEQANIYFRQQIGNDLNSVITKEGLEKLKATILAKRDKAPVVVEEHDEFFGTIINGKKTLYRPIVAFLALSLLALASVLLIKTKESWLPLFAGLGLLLSWLISGAWLYMPANILVIIAAFLLITKQKWASAIALVICSIASISLFWPTFSEIPNLQSLALQTAFWYLVPQTLVSLLMYEIAFAMQRQKYQKQIYNTEPIGSSNYEGKIAVVKVLKAERCDVCHQTDLFDVESGYCSRCQQKTV